MNETTPPMQPQSQPDSIWVTLCHLNEFPSVDAHGKESLNFQISMTIYTLIAGLSVFILIGFILLPAVLIANLVLVIIAAIKASNREFYRYPLTIRLIT
jgi:uncharacterized protein